MNSIPNQTPAESLLTELVFTTKSDEPCEECSKKSEITLELPLYTKEEYLKVRQLFGRYKITREETDYIYNFYNRVFQTNKKPGCGKCMANIIKRLQNKFENDND